MNMFEKFTPSTREVVAHAKDASKELGHDTIGTEHLLIGLIREGNGLAAVALQSLNVDESAVKDKLAQIRPAEIDNSDVNKPFTKRAKQTLELSLRESLELRQKVIATEHVLLGLTRETDGRAVQVLHSLGLNNDQIHTAVKKLIETPEQQEKVSAGKDKKSEAVLSDHAENLTEKARQGGMEPIIGREREIKRIIQILSRKTKNNPMLLGDPGVGKTAIVEGLAQAIVDGEVPHDMASKEVWSLDLASLVAGTRYRGEFEERFKGILKEIKESGNIILFIDEIHSLVGAGAAEGAIDAASMLKPPLARGELATIGATTTKEFRKYFETDAALERRFQQVDVNEPTVPETVMILTGVAKSYEDHHGVIIRQEAAEAAADLSHRYIADRFLPDKAIDLIDEASARIRIDSMMRSPLVKEIDEQLTEVRKKTEEAIKSQDFDTAHALRDEQRALSRERRVLLDKTDPNAITDEDLAAMSEDERKEIAEIRRVHEEFKRQPKPKVDAEMIAEVVSQWTGIPVFKLTAAESGKLLNMEDDLHKRVIGQRAAIQKVSKAIRRSRAGIKDPKRPAGSFIFLGPSGVGKTELAKTLTEFLFNDENHMVRIDMSEYMEKHSVSRLIGSPPGYIGHDEGGQLTEAVRGKPYSVILMDEIEKAHPDVTNILLQILEDGVLTDGKGRTVDFKNAIIIMTSNIGAKDIAQTKSIGFDTAEKSDEFSDSANDAEHQRMKKTIQGSLNKHFRPELLNRIDEIIVFHRLSKEEIVQIVDTMLQGLRGRLAEHNITLMITDEAKELLADKGYDKRMGARPLRRAIQEYIEDPLADKILESVDEEDGQRKMALISVSDSGNSLEMEIVDDVDSGLEELESRDNVSA